jgi:hypothetical protein
MRHPPDTDLKRTLFYQEVFTEAQVDLILRQLTHRFGQLDAAPKARIQALPTHGRHALAEALLDFTSAADLDAWLDTHAPDP